MLQTIDPKEQKLHQPAIAAFSDLLKVYQDFDLSAARRRKATFLIAKDSDHGIYGGAVLYPQQIYDLPDSLLLEDYEDTFRGAFITYRPHIQEFWIARICFCLEANFSPSALSSVEICKTFYRNLHDAFLAFGKSQDIEFLPFSLCTFDTLNPPFYKDWPYLPILHSDDKSELTHGILSLKGRKFIPRKPRSVALKNNNTPDPITVRRIV